jgi:hypothetical protein
MEYSFSATFEPLERAEFCLASRVVSASPYRYFVFERKRAPYPEEFRMNCRCCRSIPLRRSQSIGQSLMELVAVLRVINSKAGPLARFKSLQPNIHQQRMIIRAEQRVGWIGRHRISPLAACRACVTRKVLGCSRPGSGGLQARDPPVSSRPRRLGSSM